MHGWSYRYLCVSLIAVFAVIAGCLNAVADEGIGHVAFPSGLTHMVAPQAMQVPHHKVVSFVLKPNETTDNWTEIAGFGILHSTATMSDIMDWTPTITAPEFQQCPSTQMKVTNLSSNRMLYESDAHKCGSAPDYTQIGIIIRGKASLWHIWYGAKAPEPTPERKAEVLQKLSAVSYTK